MARPNQFVEHVMESLGAWAPVTARSMFGGYGIYRDDLIFAIVAYDTLFLKVDDLTRPEFKAAGLKPFVYSENRVSVGYFQPPVTTLDDREELAAWAEKGWQAALRAASQKAKKTPKTKPKRSTKSAKK
jgi:DNA transformation protein